MEIRTITSNDLDIVSKLDSFWSKKQFEEELSNPFSSIFVIENSENLLGFISIRLIDDICDIMNIVVDVDYRNQGIGSKLLLYVLNTVKCSTFNLEVSTNNIYAIKLYKHLGFTAIHVRKNYYKDSDAIIMQKSL